MHAAMWYTAFIFSTTCHEAAHAWSASWLGDDTARREGLVTLNPLPHVMFAPLGMVFMPLLTLATSGGCFGWGQCPYSPLWADRWPKRAALMALAGPLANLAIAVVAGLVLRFGGQAGWFVPGGPLAVGGANPGWQAGLATMCFVLLILNALLFAFNLIPLPPLDGSAVAMLFMPRAVARNYQEVLRNPQTQFIGLALILLGCGRPVTGYAVRFAHWLVVA